MISTKTHGMLDYTVGALMIALPWLLGLPSSGWDARIFVMLGIAALAYSVFTDYELGGARVIPMRVHLMLDIVSGVLLAASPFLFGFADRVMAPHLVFGAFEIGAALMTRKSPTAASA
jgi:hypothetical protein